MGPDKIVTAVKDMFAQKAQEDASSSDTPTVIIVGAGVEGTADIVQALQAAVPQCTIVATDDVGHTLAKTPELPVMEISIPYTHVEEFPEPFIEKKPKYTCHGKRKRR